MGTGGGNIARVFAKTFGTRQYKTGFVRTIQASLGSQWKNRTHTCRGHSTLLGKGKMPHAFFSLACRGWSGMKTRSAMLAEAWLAATLGSQRLPRCSSPSESQRVASGLRSGITTRLNSRNGEETSLRPKAGGSSAGLHVPTKLPGRRWKMLAGMSMELCSLCFQAARPCLHQHLQAMPCSHPHLARQRHGQKAESFASCSGTLHGTSQSQRGFAAT